jgi:predicted nucleotide-binding protein
MRQRKEYKRVLFDVPFFEALYEEFQRLVEKPDETKIWSLQVERENVKWDYDAPIEFYADLRSRFDHADYSITNKDLSADISIYNEPHYPLESTVLVKSQSRECIQKLIHICDTASERCIVPKPPPPPQPPLPKPVIFVGHGQSPLWRDVKDHLHDLHGYDVIAYESGSRAGHTIRDVIVDMLEKASFGILVMTGEDRYEDGSLGARPNVIHEIGLFQGRLGFTKAIVLLEEGTQEFSNLHGVNQIRFKKGNIREVFGDVLAVLRREFPAGKS